MYTHTWVRLPTRKMAFQDDTEAQSLEQITDEEFWERARAQAVAASSGLLSPERAGLHQYLECALQRGKCFVPLHTVEEVVPAPHRFARLPFAPHWMPGVLSWRGEIMAVVTLDDYLSGREMPLSGGLLLVARHPECVVGLRVPAVGVTTTIEPAQLMPPIPSSTLYTPARADIVAGVHAGFPVLDSAALLHDVMLHIGMAAHHA
ncbi:MAG TPA: chemotaxis protein CheW [Ktedonobacteraceae bacterium]|nr:chemotaxis protein CheW [Ktedonobacteraceae bacterium]